MVLTPSPGNKDAPQQLTKPPSFIHSISRHPLAMDGPMPGAGEKLPLPSSFSIYTAEPWLSWPAGTPQIPSPHAGQCPVNY